MKTGQLLFVILLFLFVAHAHAQQADSLLAMNSKLSDKYISAIDKKSGKAAEQIDKQTEKYLGKLEKQEAKLKKRLNKIDSSAANKIFADSKQQYEQIQNKLKSASDNITKKTSQYLPWLDSASTSLHFLDKNPVVAGLKGDASKLTGALTKVKELQNQLKQAADVKDFIRQRKEYLKEQLKRYDLGKDLKNYNQTAYYYSQQINEYREALNDPDKAEKKVLQLLNKLPSFNDFMKKNGMLARFFPIPQSTANISGTSIAQNAVGLQTRAAVEQAIQSQFQGSAGGTNVLGVLQNNIQDAQGEVNKLRELVEKLGGNSKDLDMPEFKPDQQKTKTFLQRLEYSTNNQTAKSNYYFPTTTDLALSVGYKLSDKNIIGVGMSYKLGLGKDISHISMSNEGVGFRSFMDMKLKGSLFASGGFEYNYQQPFGSPEQIKYLHDWQQSGLIGLSKVISLKTKFFKKTKLQLLYDFLSSEQRPVTQPWKFRVGYSF